MPIESGTWERHGDRIILTLPESTFEPPMRREAPSGGYFRDDLTMYPRDERAADSLPQTPTWMPIGTLSCVRGNIIRATVSRRSARLGWVVADAVRLLKKGG